MHLRAPFTDELFAHLHWERQVNEVVGMDMPQLTPPNAKLQTAKPVTMRRDPGPTQ